MSPLSMLLDISAWKPVYTQSDGIYSEGDSGQDENPTPTMWINAFSATILFTLVVYVWEHYLDFRQLESYLSTTFPVELETTIGRIDANAPKSTDSKEENQPLLPQLQAKFSKAQAYGLDKIAFSMVHSTYETIECIAFLVLGFQPYVWDKSAQLTSQFLYPAAASTAAFSVFERDHEISISLVFLAIATILGTITALPFEVYSTFYIEKEHGFNQQTASLFVVDKIKGLALTMVIGGPFVSLLLYIIRNAGPYFYVYVWVFVFLFSLFMMTIVPVVIMPLFNKYEPLPEDSILKKQIYDLAASVQYPLQKLYVMDGSTRSSHSNAFMYGFGNNKRIVLYDTLLKQVSNEEIVAILGHELGHWKLKHTLQSFVVTQLYFGAAFYMFSLVYTGSPELYASFGFVGGARPVPTLIALLLFFQTIWAPVDKILSFLLTVNSRRNEFAADEYSQGLGYSQQLQSGLCKIHVENLGAMNPDRMYSMYHYSHPPLVERLSAMMTLDKKQT
jgi:STE24 endopeptidase